MNGHSHSALVQLILPANLNTQTEFVIPDQQLLRFARVTAIEAFCAQDVAAVFPGNTPLIDGTDLAKCVLTLNTNNPDAPSNPTLLPGRFTSTEENFKYFPLTALHRVQSVDGSGQTIPFVRQLMQLHNVYPTWDKCKINIAAGGLGNSEDKAILLQVFYSWLDINGKAIQRN